MTYDEMRIRQAWPYEVKIKHAEKVAREFIEKVSAGIEYGGEKGNKFQAHNVHISVGGLDSISGWIFPKSRKVFSTGCRIAIPVGYVGMLTSKSGLMSRGITSRGTIDSGYTGVIRSVLFNHSWKFVRIRKGQKITQLVLMKIITPNLELVDSLEETDRGDNGFGSTGR